MTIYRTKKGQVFFSDGMEEPVDPDTIYDSTHSLVVGWPDAFEEVTPET